MEDELLTIQEIKKKLKVSRQAVTAWIKAGKLKGNKIGKFWRVKKSDLDKFIENDNFKK